jgi:hypothetical protein
MDENKSLAVFEDFKIRRYYDKETETWYFSVIDIIGALINTADPGDYWFKMKIRVKGEDGLELSTICRKFKFKALDGKMRPTDCANLESMFRIVQSIPSPKAEPLKLWLARVGHERVQETVDPALSMDRARENWKKLGHSDKWIEQRMQGQETRNKLTDYWKDHEIKEGREYAILTNLIHQEWSDVSIQEHKIMKSLKNQNLRDHMNEAELIFTALAELSTRQIAETMQATGMDENKVAGKKGGAIAKSARLELEAKTGKKVVSSDNYLPGSQNVLLPEGDEDEK